MPSSLDERSPMTHDVATVQPSAGSIDTVQRSGPAGALASATPRDWLLPDAAEVFRGVYTRLRMGSSIVAVCSAIAGEGKTTIALGLGVTFAQDHPTRRVLLVEADLERPVLAKDFDLESAPGLADCLLAGQPFGAAYRATFLPNLHLMPAGGPIANPASLLRSSRMASALDMMRESYDLIILDAPAILAHSDTLLLTDLADRAILVVRAGVTPTDLVERATAELTEGKLDGIILNRAHSAIPNWLRRLCSL
jgi:capsular exopolysaccharide synthesis family protein